MPSIETLDVDLSTRGVQLPRESVGMVIAQPFLRLSQEEPFRCIDQSKSQLLDEITATLEVARTAPHGAPRTHFTLFPEYSIPGLDGVAIVDDTLRSNDWPSETIVIGGMDGLSKADFCCVAGEPNTHLDTSNNDLNAITDSEWINSGITWVKGTDGRVERWLQPKLYPAWPEQDIDCRSMYRGNSVLFSRANLTPGLGIDSVHLSVSTGLPRWEVKGPGGRLWRHYPRRRLIGTLNSRCPGSLLSRTTGDHLRESFLAEVNAFFDQTDLENIRRERACLVFVNSAGRASPGRTEEYGNTSLLFASQTLFVNPQCYATFCNGGHRFRQNRVLAHHKDVLLREGGACIHSFQQVNPGSLIAGAQGRAIALTNPFVHPFGGSRDPRTPAAPVAASVKWLNDELDDIQSLGSRYPQAPLAAMVERIHCQTVKGLRTIPAASIDSSVKLATEEAEAQHADEWDHLERQAVHHLIHTLNIVGSVQSNLTWTEATSTLDWPSEIGTWV